MTVPADDREPLGRIAHAIYRDWLTEQVQRMYGDAEQQSSWEDLTEGMREAYMRMGSAVAARAVADAKLDTERMRMQLFALQCHLPAVLDALSIAVADQEYGARAKRFKAALEALTSSGEVDRGH